jgi:hypothetical protein
MSRNVSCYKILDISIESYGEEEVGVREPYNRNLEKIEDNEKGRACSTSGEDEKSIRNIR